MILAVIESDYGTLHLVDKLTLEGKEAALEITIDGNRSICSLDNVCSNCEISSQCRILSVNSRSNEAVIAALSIFNIDKTNFPELFIGL